MDPMSAYQAGRVNGASPARLVVLLYDRLLACLEEGRAALGSGNQLLAHAALTRGQRIVGELLGALNPEAGEVSENLRNLYIYLITTVELAKKEASPARLERPLAVAGELRAAWLELEHRADRGTPEGSGKAELLSLGVAP